MQVFKVLSTDWSSNSYILTEDSETAVAIDPSLQTLEVLDRKGMCCKFVLLTHGHFDHVGACGKLFSQGARICCSELEKDLIFSKGYLGIFGGVTVPEFEIHRTFTDGEEVTLCGMNFKVLETSGHTAGSCCYITKNAIFTGDTLFHGSVGRWDLPTGNYSQLIKSLQKLAALDGDYKIYSGHGEDTTLSRERAYNSYLR